MRRYPRAAGSAKSTTLLVRLASSLEEERAQRARLDEDAAASRATPQTPQQLPDEDASTSAECDSSYWLG